MKPKKPAKRKSQKRPPKKCKETQQMKLLRELLSLPGVIRECLSIAITLRKDLKEMASKAEELKAKIAEINDDLTEIDGDLQEIIDKINSTPGDGLTGAETDEVLALLGDMKTRTRAAADKVAEPEPPTP